jgi:hypothetical protein
MMAEGKLAEGEAAGERLEPALENWVKPESEPRMRLAAGAWITSQG